MARLISYLFLLWTLLLATSDAQAQRRSRRGQALVAWPSGARYYRALMPRDYFKSSRRSAYRYAPSRRAYFNRGPYRPRTRYSRPAVKKQSIVPGR